MHLMPLMPLQRLLPKIAAGLLAGSVALAVCHSTAIAQEKPATAKAPDKKTRNLARQAFADAEKAFKAEDYATAYENFSKAHELIPTPHTEYWMAKSLDLMGKAPEAIEAYETFLADPDKEKAGEEKVTDAQTRLDALKATLAGTVTLTTEPAGASISVDGEPKEGQTPMDLELSPGTHKIRLSMEGFEPHELEIEIKGGEKMEQGVTLMASAPEPVAAPPPPPPVAPPPPPPEPQKERSMVPAYITLGVAGAGAIVGTIFGIQALSSKSDFNDNPTNKAADDVERNALIADMAFGVAITLGVTGIVLLTSDDAASETGRAKATSEQAKLNVAPYVTPTGGGAAAQLIF